MASFPTGGEWEYEHLFYTNPALEDEAWPLGDREAMSGLPPSSRSDDDWDRRMKADAKAGKFTALNEDAANA